MMDSMRMCVQILSLDNRETARLLSKYVRIAFRYVSFKNRFGFIALLNVVLTVFAMPSEGVICTQSTHPCAYSNILLCHFFPSHT